MGNTYKQINKSDRNNNNNKRRTLLGVNKQKVKLKSK